jgi:hypothetical protein
MICLAFLLQVQDSVSNIYVNEGFINLRFFIFSLSAYFGNQPLLLLVVPRNDQLVSFFPSFEVKFVEKASMLNYKDILKYILSWLAWFVFFFNGWNFALYHGQLVQEKWTQILQVLLLKKLLMTFH